MDINSLNDLVKDPYIQTAVISWIAVQVRAIVPMQDIISNQSAKFVVKLIDAIFFGNWGNAENKKD